MSRPNRPTLTTANVAVALIVLLLAQLVGVTVVPRPITLKAPGELADVIPELQRFVERTRGKRFHKPIHIEQTDDLGRFTVGLQQSDTASQEQKQRDAALDQAAVFRALGLVDRSYDPLAANRTLTNDVLGAYDPVRHRLLVRTGPVTPRMRMTLVHELTHALDGEHHELRFNERSDRVVPDESRESFRALAEGNAVYVEEQYRATLSEEDKAAIEAARKPAPATLPQALLFLASYPYGAGHEFVKGLIANGGTGAVDEAFEDPPTTSEHVLNVERYLSDEQPRFVDKPLPRNNRGVVQRGVFGEFYLRLVIAIGVGNDAARQAGGGWGGGRYVAWRENRDVCVAVTLVMDTAQDTDEVVAALNQWAQGKPRAKVVPGPTVAFENCVER